MWFLTLVTKQDLWWNSRAEVEEYYRDGEYGKILQTIEARQGIQQFRHERVLASLVIRNFKTGTDELLQPNVAGYDHVEHAASLRTLFETFDSLRIWDQAS